MCLFVPAAAITSTGLPLPMFELAATLPASLQSLLALNVRGRTTLTPLVLIRFGTHSAIILHDSSFSAQQTNTNYLLSLLLAHHVYISDPI